ncbi:MAG: ZIP family metal transporter [Dictyoglomaceae bacterium]|nr:ZIP family metal transporter [Dictyoglomaceae bacterium]
MDFFLNLPHTLQAFFATLFTWGITALGSVGVFLTKEVNRKLLDTMLRFAAGVMIAASYFSLLAPSIKMAIDLKIPAWFPAILGFILGGFSLYLIDKLLPHLHLNFPEENKEGVKTTWKRTILLILAITLHNIPEGLSTFKSFFYGQLSGMVEPIAGLIGAWAVTLARPILPYALAFAAGAMIYVVVEELIPESQKSGETDLPTIGALLGFTVMMFLDIALG